MRRRSIRLAGLLSLVVLLAGCRGLPGLGGDPTNGPATPSTDQGGSAGEDGPRTIPPQLLECGESAEPQVDLTDELVASDGGWSVPSGYRSASGYYDDLAYEEQSFLETLVPQEPGYDSLDLLGVIGYVGLDWGQYARECNRVPLEAMLERVAEYESALGAQALDGAELTEVAGLPAVTQTMQIPNYTFRGYWLFSQTELLFIGCQWTSDRAQEEIADGCADLIGSVQVG
ncbi:hypothetical protein [Ruania alba]|uniref:Uncharacterized protein n=1 Tax=Ruania alba TaxID=648782 RepID=A0A1H5GK12_9MICO|nr:hypothetical protein [Ruania alba]SEE15761.1 hypothetical protein SAMN04488554_1671 [Ruania alba]